VVTASSFFVAKARAQVILQMSKMPMQ